ncbi:MAG: GAF domain-containing protein [Thermoflexales bacterium]|nr:GAF domain-containing protein [Thermoflexales bacterium]
MRERLSTWLAPTVQDVSLAQRQYLCNVTLASLIGTDILFVAASLVLGLQSPMALITAAGGTGLLLFYLGAYWLNRRGHVQVAAWAVIGGSLLGITSLTALIGIGHTTLIAFAIAASAATLLLGIQAGLASALLSATAYALIGLLQASGQLGTAVPPQDTLAIDVASLGLGVGVLIVINWVARQQITRALASEQQLRTQLETSRSELEQQVSGRTQEIERRAAQIATGAEVARAATMLHEPERLTVQVVDLIQEKFNFYYVGLFLLDPDNRYAVLHYGTGEAGRIMKEGGHQLEIGGRSMIGWVCANKQARIALDVGEEATRFANPLLPETRSEMALPLQIGDRMLGALSVQSTQGAAFDESDIAALQGMADQVAVALENARLFQQAQATLKELDEANRLLVSHGWEAFMALAHDVRQARFTPGEARPASGFLPHVLRIPLELEQQTIGTLIMERDDSSQPWTDEEMESIRAIAQQAALAMNTARLFEESQRLAARERLVNEITARIRSSITMEGVLKSAVREISQVTGASFASIDLELAEMEQKP